MQRNLASYEPTKVAGISEVGGKVFNVKYGSINPGAPVRWAAR